MTDESAGNPKKLDDKQVELNDAFDRLEKQAAEHQESSGEPELAPAKEKTAKSMTGLITLFLALVAIGLGSYSAYTTWSLQQASLAQAKSALEFEPQIIAMNRELEALSTRQRSSSGTIKAEVQALSQAQATTAKNVEAKIVSGMAELKSQLGTSSEDWLLAEAEYLLRIANQRVVMEDDIAGAIALFEAADKIIQETQGVIAFSLRSAIAEDVAALRALPSTDVDGIFVKISALAKQIPNLQQKDLRFKPEAMSEPEVYTEERSLLQKFQTALSRAGEQIFRLVDYKAKGEVVTPILPPKEEYYLRQNLRLKLQLSQLGLLKRNQSIYDQSLIEAATWVTEYFDPDSEVTKSVLASLASLSGEKIERDVPDVSASLTEIRKLMVKFHQASERSES